MLPFVEKGGDPTDVMQMMMMLVDMRWEWWLLLQMILSYPVWKIILSSRELFPLFEKSAFAKKTPQIAFLSEHVAILGYLCLASTLPYSAVLCWILFGAELETTGTLDGFFVDIDE